MDQYQRDNATVLVRVGRELGSPELGVLAALCLGWGENDMRASGCSYYQGNYYCGLFQLSPTFQAEHDYHDVAYWARRAYLDGLWIHGGIIPNARAHPDYSAGYITNLCQGAYSDLQQGADYYNRYLDEARAALAEVSGSAGGGGGGGGWHPPTLAHSPEHELDPWLIIRHDFYQWGSYGRRSYDHAQGIRELVERTGHCTERGPVKG